MPLIFLERENRTVELDASNPKEILEKLNINPTTVIVTKNNELITENVSVKKEDKIRIIPVISGG